MISFSPAAFIVLPLAVVAARRRELALAFLVGTAPFFSLTVVTAVSHNFSPAEIALLVLITRQTITCLYQDTIRLGDARLFNWFIAFGVVCIVSVVLAAFRPTAILVHPYGLGGFLNATFEPFTFGRTNLSQLALRLFFVVGVLAVAMTVGDIDEIKQLVRWLVFTGVLVGAVGILYQLSIIFDVQMAGYLKSFGFRRFNPTPQFTGPIPRMYSLPGEPGFTADYLLYTLAISVALSLSPDSGGVFTRRTTHFITFSLLLMLLLSTGTTGYGGIAILVFVLVGASLVFNSIPLPDIKRSFPAVIVLVATGAVGDLLLSGGALWSLVGYQIEKLSFQAGSGSVRLQYMLRTVDVIAARPLLGVGVGSHRVPSMMFTLAAEVGLVGLGVFLGLHVSLFRRCSWVVTKAESDTSILAFALLVSNIALLLTNLLAKSISTLIFAWYWLSLALPFAVVLSWNRKRPEG